MRLVWTIVALQNLLGRRLRVKRTIVATACAMATAFVCAAVARGETALAATKLRCEYKVDPAGIDVKKPRLSWELVSAERGVLQTSYEVRVAGSEAELAKGKVIWDSGTQASDASIQVEYGGPAVASGKIYFWQVRVADNHGHTSDWSKAARWEMGLLEARDWKAKWITPNVVEDEKKSNPAPMLRRELELNGKRVGEEYFTPGWTAYDFRYQYQIYDVTGLVKSGGNCLGAMIGDG